MRWTTMAIIAALVCTSAPCSLAGTAYAVRVLNVPQGWQSVQPHAINNRSVAVGSASTSPGDSRAVIWNESGVASELRLPDGCVHAVAHDINDCGQVAGVAEDAQGNRRAVMWDASGNPTLIDVPVEGVRVESLAHGINDAGQVAGFVSTDTREYAFLWSQDGGLLDLGANLGWQWSVAIGINDRGQVVGWYSDVPGSQNAFLWTSGQAANLGAACDGRSSAWDVNDAGQVIGSASDAAYSAVTWTASGVRSELPCLGVRSEAWAINDAGVIAGVTSVPLPNGFPVDRATAWDADREPTLLSEAQSRAYGINDSGLIVGTVGQVAVIWEPVPEPSGLLALLAGIGSVGMIARRRIARVA